MMYVLLFSSIICSFWTILLIVSAVAESHITAMWNMVKGDSRPTKVSIMPSLIMAIISALGWVAFLITINL